MRYPLTCLAAMTAAIASVQAQEDRAQIEPGIRRFVSVYDWAVQDSKLPARLERVIRGLATELKLTDSARRKLLSGLPATLKRYRIEQATAWAQPKNADLVNTEAWSLRSSTHLVELSSAWRAMLKACLEPEKFRAWEATSVERNKSARARLARLAELKRKKGQLIRFRGVPADGVSRLSDALTVGRFRGRSRNDLDEAIKAARRAIVERGERARAATQLEFEIRIMELDFACSLTAAQKRKLLLLIKGVVSKRHAETDQQVEVYLEHLKEPKPRDAVWISRLLGPQPRPSEDKTHRAFWDRMKGKVLTSEQKKLLKQDTPK